MASDDAGEVIEAQRCVRFEPGCSGDIRVFPTWPEFREVYVSHFGVAELAATDVDVVVVPLVKVSVPAAGRRTSK